LKAIDERLNVPPDNVEVSFIPGKEPGPKKLSGNAHAVKTMVREDRCSGGMIMLVLAGSSAEIGM
jgi:hypothetical protein